MARLNTHRVLSSAGWAGGGCEASQSRALLAMRMERGVLQALREDVDGI